MENLKVSDLFEILMTTYSFIFGKADMTEEEAIMSKALIDYSLRAVKNGIANGVDEHKLPIITVTLWQDMRSDKDFSLYFEKVDGRAFKDNKLDILIKKLQAAFNEWGVEVLENTFSVDAAGKWDIER